MYNYLTISLFFKIISSLLLCSNFVLADSNSRSNSDELIKRADSLFFEGAGHTLQENNVLEFMTLSPDEILKKVAYLPSTPESEKQSFCKQLSQDFQSSLKFFASEFQIYDGRIRGRELPLPQKGNLVLDISDHETASNSLKAMKYVLDDYKKRAERKTMIMMKLRIKYEELERGAIRAKEVIKEHEKGANKHFNSAKERENTEKFADYAHENFPKFITDLDKNISCINNDLIKQVKNLSNELSECCNRFDLKERCNLYKLLDVPKEKGEQYKKHIKYNKGPKCLKKLTSQITGFDLKNLDIDKSYKKCPKITLGYESKVSHICDIPQNTLTKSQTANIDEILRISDRVKKNSLEDDFLNMEENKLFQNIKFEGISNLESVKEGKFKGLSLVIPSSYARDLGTGEEEKPLHYINKIVYWDVRNKIESEIKNAKNILSSLNKEDTEAYKTILKTEKNLERFFGRHFRNTSFDSRLRGLYNTFPDYFDKLVDSNPLYKPLFCYFQKDLADHKKRKQRIIGWASGLTLAAGVVGATTVIPSMILLKSAALISIKGATGVSFLKTGINLMDQVQGIHKSTMNQAIASSLLNNEIEVLNFASACNKIEKKDTSFLENLDKFKDGCETLKKMFKEGDLAEVDGNEFYQEVMNLNKGNIKDFHTKLVTEKNDAFLTFMSMFNSIMNITMKNIDSLKEIRQNMDKVKKGGVTPEDLIKELPAIFVKHFNEKSSISRVNALTEEKVLDDSKPLTFGRFIDQLGQTFYNHVEIKEDDKTEEQNEKVKKNAANTIAQVIRSNFPLIFSVDGHALSLKTKKTADSHGIAIIVDENPVIGVESERNVPIVNKRDVLRRPASVRRHQIRDGDSTDFNSSLVEKLYNGFFPHGHH